MRSYSIKTLILHFAIATAYFATTSYFFVLAKDPDPIGTGLRQWACILLHVFITLLITLPSSKNASNKRFGWQKVFLHLAFIVLIVSVYLLFSTQFWQWLWSIR